ncbi:MAG: glycosyltransferase [Planctomycetes bacterium]|nr:glycosyltransferase [Planctomycetota bacterium]
MPLSHPLIVTSALSLLILLAYYARTMWIRRNDAYLSPTEADERALVSVLIPARDEAQNIAPCVRSFLAQTHRNLEIIVIDDHSTDGTFDVAQTAGAGDPRLKVIRADPLPEGWAGKSHALVCGERHASGDFLLLTDADTVHHPAGVASVLAYLRRENADMVSVAAEQECSSIGEAIVQPMVITLLDQRHSFAEVARIGEGAPLSCNGQLMLVRRDAYDRAGGYCALRAEVPTDYALAALVKRSGLEYRFAFAPGIVRTRMYDSLRASIDGWSKNLYQIVCRPESRGALAKLFALTFAIPAVTTLPFVCAVMLCLADASIAGTGASTLAPGSLLLALYVFIAGEIYRAHTFTRAQSLLAPIAGPVAVLILWLSFLRSRKKSARLWKGRALPR